MSGEKSNNHIDRRAFLKLSGLLAALPYLGSCNGPAAATGFKTRIVGANSKTGHLLRTNVFPEPTRTEHLDIAIIGAGISGLSAARWLQKNGCTDFRIFELDTAAGGNAKGGENAISKYPFAAHYLPVANESFTELTEFLREHDIITGFDAAGIPSYNEYYLCFEPQERLFYRGLWQEGLPPKSGLTEEETKELLRFIKLTEDLKAKKGKDGLPAFTIPLELSSADEELMALDKLTMSEYLEREHYHTPFLKWFINYCCKDDFGTSVENTSAWAALHYFCSRTGKASNASPYDLLTWPEGNNFLAKKLETGLKRHIHTQMLTYKVEQENDRWCCYIYDVKKGESIKYVCGNVIMATPQFVNKRILKAATAINWEGFSYYPWIVANISIKNKAELNGMQDLCWDNVFYNSESLGYVNACHQAFDRDKNTAVLTYYYNFSAAAAKEERLRIYKNDEAYWQKFIVDDLKTAHPNIEELITDIEVNVLGHGMISPVKGFRTSESRVLLDKGLPGLYFAHSDISGISLFEQAFYRGILAAKQLLTNQEQNA